MRFYEKFLRYVVLILPFILLSVLIPELSLLILALMFPGYVLTSIVMNRSELGLYGTLIVSFGVGITILPLLVYILSVLSIPFNVYTVFVYLLFFIPVGFLFGDLRSIFSLRDDIDITRTVYILSFILSIGIITRILPVLGMNAPLFADPAVEGTLSRLIVQNQGLPQTWEPFLSLDVRHQPGFASIISTFHIMSGMEISEIILFFTNLLYALFPLSIYSVARKVFKESTRALVASLLSLAAAFPTYLFITGMNSGVTVFFLVPIGFGLVLESLRRFSYRKFFLVFIFSVGSVLIHPLYVFFLVLVSVPYVLYLFSSTDLNVKPLILVFGSAVLIPLLIVSPYFHNVTESTHLAEEQWEMQSNYINPERKVTIFSVVEPVYILFDNPNGVWYRYFSFDVLLSPIGLVFVFLLLFSVYRILYDRSKLGLLLIAWYLLFLSFSVLQSVFKLKFVGWEFIYPSRVKFLIVLPLVLLLSYPFKGKLWGGSLKRTYRNISLPLLVLLISIPFSIVFLTSHMYDLSERTVVSEYEVNGMDWIDENIEKDSVILNSLVDVEAGAFIGGPGQWIPVYTGNKVLFPATSLTGRLGDVSDRREVAEYLKDGSPEDERFVEILGKYNVSYIYTSMHKMNTEESSMVLWDKIPEDSDHYEMVYNNVTTKIYRLTAI